MQHLGYPLEMAGRGAAKALGTLRMYIPAGKASPSPPLGPALGQVKLIMSYGMPAAHGRFTCL